MSYAALLPEGMKVLGRLDGTAKANAIESFGFRPRDQGLLGQLEPPPMPPTWRDGGKSRDHHDLRRKPVDNRPAHASRCGTKYGRPGSFGPMRSAWIHYFQASRRSQRRLNGFYPGVF